MTLTHPIDDIFKDGVPPNKAAIRAYERLLDSALDVNDVRSRDLQGTKIVVVNINNKAYVFGYDPTDTESDDDGLNVLKDAVNRRFKRTPLTPSDLTAAILNAVFGTGGLDLAAIPGAAPHVLLGSEDDEWASVTMEDLVAWLDAFFGSSVWRQDFSEFINAVAALPANDRRMGAICGYNRAVLLSDGAVAVCGYMGTASPDGGATSLSKLQRIAFVDGVRRYVSKFWAGTPNGSTVTTSLFALDENGIVWAWGGNSNGQLGVGDLVARDMWEEITFFRLNGLTVSNVFCSPSGRSTYFLCTNGQLYYTGYNANGQAGDNTTTQKTSPVRCGTLTGVTDVFPGSEDTATDFVGCLAGGAFYVWGYNGFGNLGLGDLTQRTTPTNTGVTNVVRACMGRASILLRSDGTVWSCGSNGSGGTGQGTISGNTTTWTAITGLVGVSDITMTPGNTPSCAAIFPDKTIKVWGRNNYGQLSLGDQVDKTTPQTPAAVWQGSVDEVRFSTSLGDSPAMFVKAGEQLYGSGYNGQGNLAVGDFTVINTNSRPVIGLRGRIVDWVVMGDWSISYGLIVLTDVACLGGGYNAYGQVGITEGALHNTAVLQSMILSMIGSGANGWSPIFAVEIDGATELTSRRVLRVVDWVGGEGPKPTTGLYVGLVGLVELISDAVNIRGPTGLAGEYYAIPFSSSLGVGANETLLIHPIAIEILIPEDMIGSKGIALGTATADRVFSLFKNASPTPFATFTFFAGNPIPTFVCAADVLLVPGDYVVMKGPTGADPTLKNFGVSILALRSSL
jgi:alpha-tubulin suppressor-like RCC1 family protein